jgi:carboxymethylenebutenolidase
MAENWSVKQVWLCGKCGADNELDSPFCVTCATREEAIPKTDNNKVNKLLEPLAKALRWSVENSPVKPEVVLAEAQKIGLKAPNLSELRNSSLIKLDKLAGNIINSNRLMATGTGIGTGLPGGLAIVATLPAWYASMVHFSMRAISGVSQTYGFEATSTAGRVMVLAGFAAASEMPDLLIGTRKLNIQTLTDYLLNNTTAKPELLIPPLCRQLARHIAIDFAKMGWVNFIPVLGSVVDGTYSYLYLNNIGKKSKKFYRELLFKQNPALIAPDVSDSTEIKLTSRFVTFQNTEGFEVKCYLARPADAQMESGGAVLVLHDESGLGEQVYSAARKLARQGYLTLAPNLHARRKSSLTKQEVSRDIAATLRYLRENSPENYLVGLVGFGWGADAILHFSGNAACGVAFYPRLTETVLVADLQMPLLIQYGTEDNCVLNGSVQKLMDAIRVAKKIGEVTVYEGANSYFEDVDNPNFKSAVADIAWDESFSWFEQYLRP